MNGRVAVESYSIRNCASTGTSDTISPLFRGQTLDNIMPACPVRRSKSQGESISTVAPNSKIERPLSDLHLFNEWFHEVYSGTHSTLCRTMPTDHPIILVLGDSNRNR